MKPIAYEIAEEARKLCWATVGSDKNNVCEKCIEQAVNSVLRKRMPKRPEYIGLSKDHPIYETGRNRGNREMYDEWTRALSITQHEEKEWCKHWKYTESWGWCWTKDQQYIQEASAQGANFCPFCGTPRPKPPTETGGEGKKHAAKCSAIGCNTVLTIENDWVCYEHEFKPKEHAESVQHRHQSASGDIYYGDHEGCPYCHKPKPSESVKCEHGYNFCPYCNSCSKCSHEIFDTPNGYMCEICNILFRKYIPKHKTVDSELANEMDEVSKILKNCDNPVKHPNCSCFDEPKPSPVKECEHKYIAGSCCGDGAFCTCPKPVLRCKFCKAEKPKDEPVKEELPKLPEKMKMSLDVDFNSKYAIVVINAIIEYLKKRDNS